MEQMNLNGQSAYRMDFIHKPHWIESGSLQSFNISKEGPRLWGSRFFWKSRHTALDFLTFAPCTFVRHALYNLDLKRHFLFFSSQNRPLHWDGPRAALKRDPFIFFVSISLHMFASECTSLTSIRIKIIWFTYFVLVTSNIENVPVPFWTKSTQWHNHLQKRHKHCITTDKA